MHLYKVGPRRGCVDLSDERRRVEVRPRPSRRRRIVIGDYGEGRRGRRRRKRGRRRRWHACCRCCRRRRRRRQCGRRCGAPPETIQKGDAFYLRVNTFFKGQSSHIHFLFLLSQQLGSYHKPLLPTDSAFRGRPLNLNNQHSSSCLLFTYD